MKVASVLVVGAGTMGAGIAQWFVQQGIPAALMDQSPSQAEAAILQLHSLWEQWLKKGKISPPTFQKYQTLLTCSESPPPVNDGESLVIEAIIEAESAKSQLFSALDQRLPEHVIFATNTSSLSINYLANCLSPARRSRFLGLHFFNPAPVMKLVEIIEGEFTEAGLAQKLYHWFLEQGKEPALCQDTPGFLVNRIARGFYGEALRIVEHDRPELYREVDTVMREIGQFKMGPFELLDLIGVDVNLSVTTSVWQAMAQSARFTPHNLQQEIVRQGRLGKKVKRGFYTYE